MKRKITITVALVLGFFSVSLMSSDSTVVAQRNLRFTADTGIVSLGPNQILRISVDPQDNTVIYFRRFEYSMSICNSDQVCKHALSSQSTTAPVMLMSGEAASFDIPNTGSGVRGILVSSQRVTANAQIIDVTTGNVNGIIAILIG